MFSTWFRSHLEEGRTSCSKYQGSSGRERGRKDGHSSLRMPRPSPPSRCCACFCPCDHLKTATMQLTVANIIVPLCALMHAATRHTHDQRLVSFASVFLLGCCSTQWCVIVLFVIVYFPHPHALSYFLILQTEVAQKFTPRPPFWYSSSGQYQDVLLLCCWRGWKEIGYLNNFTFTGSIHL